MTRMMQIAAPAAAQGRVARRRISRASAPRARGRLQGAARHGDDGPPPGRPARAERGARRTTLPRMGRRPPVWPMGRTHARPAELLPKDACASRDARDRGMRLGAWPPAARGERGQRGALARDAVGRRRRARAPRRRFLWRAVGRMQARPERTRAGRAPLAAENPRADVGTRPISPRPPRCICAGSARGGDLLAPPRGGPPAGSARGRCVCAVRHTRHDRRWPGVVRRSGGGAAAPRRATGGRAVRCASRSSRAARRSSGAPRSGRTLLARGSPDARRVAPRRSGAPSPYLPPAARAERAAPRAHGVAARSGRRLAMLAVLWPCAARRRARRARWCTRALALAALRLRDAWIGLGRLRLVIRARASVAVLLRRRKNGLVGVDAACAACR